MQANQRTLELTGSIVEYIIKEKRAKGGAAGTPYSTHKTPFNPIFNPRYAATDTKKALQTGGSNAAPSTGKATGGKEWHLTKSKELAELEAALKTMPPRAQRRGHATGATPSTNKADAAVGGSGPTTTGKKRKYTDDDSAVTPAEHPPSKRQPSTTPYANTLDLKRAIIRRPGAPKPNVTSRLGRPSTAATPLTTEKQLQEQKKPVSTVKTAQLSHKKVKFSPCAASGVFNPMAVASTNKGKSNLGRMQSNTPCGSNTVTTDTPNGSVARRPTIRTISTAKSHRVGGSSSTSLRVAAAIRATVKSRQTQNSN